MAFKVKGELSMDGSKFFGVMGQAGAAVTRFGNHVQSNIGSRLAAAFSVGAMGLAIRRTMDYADSLEEMASRIGVSTDKLQEWNFAAKQSGADAQKLLTFIERLATAAGDMKNLPGFQAMGINPQGMTPEGLFGAVSGATRGKGSTEIVQMLQGVGLSVRQIGPMVNVLASDLDAAGQSAQKLGAVIDQQTIRALASLNDQLSIVGQILMGQFAPALLAAGKLAIATFGKIHGALSFLKNADPRSVVSRTALNPAHAPELIYMLGRLVGGDPEARGGFKAGAKAYKDIDRQTEAMLRAIENYKPAPLPTITPAAGGTESRKAQRIATSDALISVGNFLGSNRGVMESMARRQVQLLQRIADNTAPKNEAETDSGFPE